MPELSAYLASDPDLFDPYLGPHRGYMTPQDGAPGSAYEGVNLGPGDHITSTQRQAGLQALVNYCGANNWNLVIPANPLPYDIDNNISLRLAPSIGIQLFGVIRNVRASSAIGGIDMACFKIGNHHPQKWAADGSGGVVWRAGGDVAEGARSFTIASGVSDFSVGGLVIIRGAAFYNSGSNDSPLFMLISRVTAIAGTLVTIDHPFDEAVTGILVATSTQVGATDPQGEASFIADRASIVGPGGLVSARNPLMRTTMFMCNIDIGFTQGRSAFFGNCFSFTRFRIGHVSADERMADIAGGSHYSVFECDTVDYAGPGDGLPFMQMNESARACSLRIGRVMAMSLSEGNSGIAAFTTSRRCLIELGEVKAPLVVNTPFAFNNPAPTSGTQPLLHDNQLIVRDFKGGSAFPRFVSANNAGTENKRNRVSGKFRGTPTTDAVRMGGDGHQVGPDSFFESGQLALGAGGAFAPTNLVADGISFPAGISGSTTGQRIRAF